MSIYEYILNHRKDEDTFLVHEKRQKNFERAIMIIFLLSFFGGLIAFVAIKNLYNIDIALLCGSVGAIWYSLGYGYCTTLWNKEKDFHEYSEFFKKYYMDEEENS